MRSWDATGVRGRFEKRWVQCGCLVCMRQKPRLLTGQGLRTMGWAVHSCSGTLSSVGSEAQVSRVVLF